MTALKPWAFIFKSPGATQPRDYAEFTSKRHHTFIYGVDNLDDACELAKRLVAEGCLFIELCGGFGEEGTHAIIKAIDCDVPVGYVTHTPEEAAKLQKKLAKFQ